MPKGGIEVAIMSKQSNREVEILVVDPDVAFTREVDSALVGEGFVCRTARSGSEAWQIARRQMPAVLIIELDLQDMDGFECYRQIANLNPWQELAVIYVSSKRSPDVVRRSREAGGIFFLSKPVDTSVLLELVGKALWMPQLIRRHLDHEAHSPMAKGPRILSDLSSIAPVEPRTIDATLAEFDATS